MTHDPRDVEMADLSAYLDGELDAARASEVERWLARSAEARAALDELRAVSRGLRDLPRLRAPAGLADAIVARHADRPAGQQSAARRAVRPFGAWPRATLSAAAMLVFGVFLGWWTAGVSNSRELGASLAFPDGGEAQSSDVARGGRRGGALAAGEAAVDAADPKESALAGMPEPALARADKQEENAPLEALAFEGGGERSPLDAALSAATLREDVAQAGVAVRQIAPDAPPAIAAPRPSAAEPIATRSRDFLPAEMKSVGDAAVIEIVIEPADEASSREVDERISAAYRADALDAKSDSEALAPTGELDSSPGAPRESARAYGFIAADAAVGELEFELDADRAGELLARLELAAPERTRVTFSASPDGLAGVSRVLSAAAAARDRLAQPQFAGGAGRAGREEADRGESDAPPGAAAASSLTESRSRAAPGADASVQSGEAAVAPRVALRIRVVRVAP